MYGHRSEASLRNYIGSPSSEQLRAYFDILPDALSERPHQSQQPNFTALLSRAIFMFPWIRPSFTYKTHTLSSLFSNCYVKKITCFSVPRFGWISLNISLSGWKTSGKSVKFDRQTISVCELLQIVNFDGLKFFTALVLFNQSDYMNFSKEDSDRLIVGCFIRE